MTAAHCVACGAESRSGRRFCARCGSALELQCPLARAQLEYAELLARVGRPAADVAAQRNEAVHVFERLGATPWLARADALGSAVPA